MDKVTEQQNSKSKKIDMQSTYKILSIINDEDKAIAFEVEKYLYDISLLVDKIVHRIQNDGKLFYIGCGTSGRLGVLDAAECPPTFSTEKNLVQGIIAGGKKALSEAIENVEDSKLDGIDVIQKHKINNKDILIGISANGDAPFVHGALEYAKKNNTLTALLCCNDIKKYNYIDHLVSVIVGPEIIAGSTRMKAGTATKMILNMISTATMIKLNKVYNNYMVDLKINNKKLFNRAINIISTITNSSKLVSKNYLINSKGNVKVAIIMNRNNVDYNSAILQLEKNKGNLNKILKK